MIVAIVLDIIANAVFQELGNPINTNWCIFINFFDYMAWSSVYMNIAFTLTDKKMPKWVEGNSTFITWVFNISGIIYACYALIELTYINANFDMYKLAMFQSKYEVSHALAIGLAIVFYLCVKKYKEKNEIFKYV